ncbi:unnamed protein product [Moneuplotes crassus]|uniref:Uncharacterized protein n=1 Tax=Euplotes crassus TaxID=5936 RepID=A0AAD1U8V8_EUPCR|nr:unnamed protein product [Moneuplotes crassus]
MEGYVQYCDEECKQRAKYYDEADEMYYCELHFRKNNQPKSAIRLTSQSEVKDDVNLLEKGLKTFLIFIKENYDRRSQPNLEEIYEKFSKELDKLNKQIRKAESHHQPFLFAKYKKQAELMKKAINGEIDFNDFTNNFFWNLLKEEGRTPSSSQLIYDIYRNLEEVDLHQEEFIRRNAHIKKLKARIKELKKEISRLQESKEPSSPTDSIPESSSSASSSEEFESPLQEEMKKDSRCREFVEKIEKEKEAVIGLEVPYGRKLLGLVDKELLSGVKRIILVSVRMINKNQLHSFISITPPNLTYFYLSLGDSAAKISPYLPSILLLSSKMKGKLWIHWCRITKKERDLMNQTFGKSTLVYGEFRILICRW